MRSAVGRVGCAAMAAAALPAPADVPREHAPSAQPPTPSAASPVRKSRRLAAPARSTSTGALMTAPGRLYVGRSIPDPVIPSAARDLALGCWSKYEIPRCARDDDPRVRRESAPRSLPHLVVVLPQPVGVLRV